MVFPKIAINQAVAVYSTILHQLAIRSLMTRLV